MGAEVCRAVSADPGMQLVAAVDPVAAGAGLSSLGDIQEELIVDSGSQALLEAGAEVAVDFTVASSALVNIKWCIDSGIHVVVGTTGLSSAVLEELGALAQARGTGLLVAPNFAIGAVLMMKFAETAAKWLPDAEIIELHHSAKLDSPSGTAIKTAEMIAGARSQVPNLPDAETDARGAEKDGVRIHSVRLPGLVAHQEVIFGGLGQTLTIRHDSMDRTSFMPGVLLGIREISKHPGLTIGLEHLLSL